SYFFCLIAYHLNLNSFPTRRSSDLISEGTPAIPSGTIRSSQFGRLFLHNPLLARMNHLIFLLLMLQFLNSASFPFFADIQKPEQDRKSTRLNSSHLVISYAVFCLKK